MLLCKDSNTSEWIYIVKTGSCRVLKDLIETRPNIPGLEFIDYSAFDTTVSKYIAFSYSYIKCMLILLLLAC